ncbi:hypothetical protein TSOC_015345, partial [Tetrabaena socialis]
MRAAADAAQAKYKKPAQLLLCMLPDKLVDEYKEIKRVSDVELGIPSQVVAGTKLVTLEVQDRDASEYAHSVASRSSAFKAKIGYRVQRGGGPQYCANVAMKINNKLGGVN